MLLYGGPAGHCQLLFFPFVVVQTLICSIHGQPHSEGIITFLSFHDAKLGIAMLHSHFNDPFTMMELLV